MATMEDIAKKVGVSKGTVSKALNGAADVSETLRKTIVETAVELGYTRARRGAVRTLCIFIENMGYTRRRILVPTSSPVSVRWRSRPGSMCGWWT